MSQINGNEQLTEDSRKQIFLAIVDAQDRKMDVAQARITVMERFGLSESQVRLIEREGIDCDWPPL